jgi:hypothetical protein
VPAEQVVKDIRRATRRHFSAEDKIRIVLEGLRSEDSIAELCRREGIVQNLYYRWSKEFLEAGKKRLAGGAATAQLSPMDLCTSILSRPPVHHHVPVDAPPAAREDSPACHKHGPAWSGSGCPEDKLPRSNAQPPNRHRRHCSRASDVRDSQ